MALSHWNGVALADLSAFNTVTDISAINGESASLGSDITAPTLSSATVAANGTTLTLVFDEAVTRGSGYADADLNLDASTTGSDIGLTYVSGDGTNTFVYTIASEIQSGETVDLDFNGDADSLEDGSGNDLAAIVSGAVTNNSTQGTAYLVNQRFEGANYDNGESWTETGIGVVDEDYTGVVLDGTQSLRLSGTGEDAASKITFSATSEIWGYMMFRTQGSNTVSNILRILAAADTPVASVYNDGTGKLVAYDDVGASGTAGTVDAMSPDTTYHLMWRYKKGTGSDSVIEVEFSTTPTFTGSGNKFTSKTNGQAVSDAVGIELGNRTAAFTYDLVFDKVIVDDVAIGNNPP